MDKLEEPWTRDTNLESFERELAEEISENNHVLSGIKTKALRKRQDNDDVLFALLDGTGRVAVVHLAYCGSELNDNAPTTIVFESYDQWIKDGYSKDIEDFNRF